MAQFEDITQVYVEKKAAPAGGQSIPTAAQMQDPNFDVGSFLNQNVGGQSGGIQISFRNVPAMLDIERVTTFARYFNVQTNQFEGDVLEIKLAGGGDGGLIHVRSTYPAFKTLMGL